MEKEVDYKKIIDKMSEKEIVTFAEVLKEDFVLFVKVIHYLVYGTEFVYEELHDELFAFWNGIDKLEHIFCNLNLPPRSYKTGSIRMFFLWSIIKRYDCKFIYISYGNALLKDMSKELRTISTDIYFQKLFPYIGTNYLENIDYSVDGWDGMTKEEREHKNYYNANEVRIGSSAIVLATLGGVITGFGAGIRTIKQEFTGMICMDDIEKISDTTSSKVKRDKVQKWIKEVVFSRRNNPNVPICNVQQRVNAKDVTNFLEEEYEFETIKMPLLVKDENGVERCVLPLQYNQKTLNLLRKDYFFFQTQYQQEALVSSNTFIKEEWFKWYDKEKVVGGVVDDREDYILDAYFTCDTAFTDKNYSDNSAIMFCIINSRREVMVIDCQFGKWDMMTLKETLSRMYYDWSRWVLQKYGRGISGVYIEHKGSGIILLQEMRSGDGGDLGEIPVVEIMPTAKGIDMKGTYREMVAGKWTRWKEVESFVMNGKLFLPLEQDEGELVRGYWQERLMEEVKFFNPDTKNKWHDDLLDCIIYAMKVYIMNVGVGGGSDDYGELLEELEEGIG